MSVSIVVSNKDPFGVDSNVEKNFWNTTEKKSHQLDYQYYKPTGCFPRGKAYWRVVSLNYSFHDSDLDWF